MTRSERMTLKALIRSFQKIEWKKKKLFQFNHFQIDSPSKFFDKHLQFISAHKSSTNYIILQKHQSHNLVDSYLSDRQRISTFWQPDYKLNYRKSLMSHSPVTRLETPFSFTSLIRWKFMVTRGEWSRFLGWDYLTAVTKGKSTKRSMGKKLVTNWSLRNACINICTATDWKFSRIFRRLIIIYSIQIIHCYQRFIANNTVDLTCQVLFCMIIFVFNSMSTY